MEVSAVVSDRRRLKIRTVRPPAAGQDSQVGTVDELAVLLRLDRRTVYAMVAEGRFLASVVAAEPSESTARRWSRLAGQDSGTLPGRNG